MASILYREGKGHIENGVECEMILVEYDQYESMLSAGWDTEPPGAKPATAPAEMADDQDPDAIRAAAKAAGIEGWDTKRIATLRKLLES